MENLEDQKKYRAVRDAIMKLFSDGYCHTMDEIRNATKVVTITTGVKNANGKYEELELSIPSGFNDVCCNKLIELCLVPGKKGDQKAAASNDPDYYRILKKTMELSKWKDHKGRNPKFYLLRIAPKMNAKEEDNRRVITTKQIEMCYDASRAVNSEMYAKEREAKQKQFEELKSIGLVKVHTAKLPLSKDELMHHLPPFIKKGSFSMPKMDRYGMYKIKIRFGRDMVHELHLRVEPNKEEEVNVVVKEPEKPSFEKIVSMLKDKCQELGLTCEITLK